MKKNTTIIVKYRPTKTHKVNPTSNTIYIYLSSLCEKSVLAHTRVTTGQITGMTQQQKSHNKVSLNKQMKKNKCIAFQNRMCKRRMPPNHRENRMSKMTPPPNHRERRISKTTPPPNHLENRCTYDDH